MTVTMLSLPGMEPARPRNYRPRPRAYVPGIEIEAGRWGKCRVCGEVTDWNDLRSDTNFHWRRQLKCKKCAAEEQWRRNHGGSARHDTPDDIRAYRTKKLNALLQVAFAAAVGPPGVGGYVYAEVAFVNRVLHVYIGRCANLPARHAQHSAGQVTLNPDGTSSGTRYLITKHRRRPDQITLAHLVDEPAAATVEAATIRAVADWCRDRPGYHCSNKQHAGVPDA